MLLAGLVLLLIGVFSFIYPWNTYIKIVTYSGFAMFFNGLFILIHALKDHHQLPERVGLIVEGCLDMLVGGLLVLNPFLAAIAFPIIVGYWMIFRGFIKICLALYIRNAIAVRLLVGIIGLFSFSFGAVILFDPLTMNQKAISVIGIFSFLIGALYCYDALRFRKRPDILNSMM